MPERNLVVVRSPFFSGPRMVGIGEVWSSDDPIVKSYPNAFRPIEIKSSVVAAPQRRPTRKPAAKRSTKSTAKKS